MEHRVTFKTQDGILQERMFDNFNEFADSMDEIANQYYAGMKPEVSVDTIYDNMVKKEKVTNEQPSEPRGMEFLSEIGPEPQG
jgi:NAD-dependent DNA ligase